MGVPQTGMGRWDGEGIGGERAGEMQCNAGQTDIYLYPVDFYIP